MLGMMADAISAFWVSTAGLETAELQKRRIGKDEDPLRRISN